MKQPTDHDWMPVPDAVALLLGRVTYYAAWLDDVLGDAIIASSLEASDASETTPGWASSGTQLVTALRRIDVGDTRVNDLAGTLAGHLEDLNVIRYQLVHGVWLWDRDSVMVMKRSLNPGQRSVEYARFTYAELIELIANYRQLGHLAERFADLLSRGNPVHTQTRESVTPRCPTDGVLLAGALVDDIIVWQCEVCGMTLPSVPDRQKRT